MLCAFSLSGAQMTGPEPGATDPVGAPASYITLRSDDLMIGEFDRLDTYEVDTNSALSTPIAAASGLGVNSSNSILASGRILSQDHDQAVNVGRSPGATSVDVRFPDASQSCFPTYTNPSRTAPIKSRWRWAIWTRFPTQTALITMRSWSSYAIDLAPDSPIGPYALNLSIELHHEHGLDAAALPDPNDSARAVP